MTKNLENVSKEFKKFIIAWIREAFDIWMFDPFDLFNIWTVEFVVFWKIVDFLDPILKYPMDWIFNILRNDILKFNKYYALRGQWFMPQK